jgi:hypothetical protein
MSLQSFQPKLIVGSVGNLRSQVLGSMSMDTREFSHEYTHIDPRVTRTRGMPYCERVGREVEGRRVAGEVA